MFINYTPVLGIILPYSLFTFKGIRHIPLNVFLRIVEFYVPLASSSFYYSYNPHLNIQFFDKLSCVSVIILSGLVLL